MMGYIRTAVVACGLAGGILLTGCSSDNSEGAKTQESQKAGVSLKATRQELVKSKAEVNQAIAALDKLAAGGNLPESYKQYSTAVTNVEAAGTRARTRAQEMRANGRAYVTKWEQETEQVSSPELRAGAAARRQGIKEHYEEIVTAGQAVRDAYQPFLKDLQDIRRALASDLTPAGIESAKLAMDKSKTEGETLNEKIDVVIAKLDEVAGGMSSSGATSASSGQSPTPPMTPAQPAPTTPAQPAPTTPAQPAQ